jgi:NAD(P)-dependent dehydrogenase (short-subunit alcohol dehydrogenase family)
MCINVHFYLGCAVVLACRDVTRGKTTASEVRQAQQEAGFKANATVQRLDLMDLGSVVQCADSIATSGQPLHILINNAGIYDLSGVLLCLCSPRPNGQTWTCLLT